MRLSVSLIFDVDFELKWKSEKKVSSIVQWQMGWNGTWSWGKVCNGDRFFG